MSRARSANEVVRYVRNVASAAASLRSISSVPRASYVLSVSPFAGFTVAMGMADLLKAGCSPTLPRGAARRNAGGPPR
jgi:hypothetical protein